MPEPGGEISPPAEVTNALETKPCFIFLNHGNWLTANNLSMGDGRLFSASWAMVPNRIDDLISGDAHWRPDRVDDKRHCGAISPFGASQISHGGWRLQLEMDAERIRAESFPNCPSRLAGLFVFPDLPTCHQVHNTHGWDLGQVAEMRYVALREAALDMEIVSMANRLYATNSFSSEAANRLWSTYWSGGVISDLGITPASQSIQELLIDGVVRPIVT